MSPPPPSLLGPPDIGITSTTTTFTFGSKNNISNLNQSIYSFLENTKNIFHGASRKHPMGFTENNSATFLASGNPCLDFFFHIVPDTPRDEVVGRLQMAWNHDPLTTLKLICNLRGVRGTGKSEKEGFYTAALWLFQNHPQTLSKNVPQIADFGYFKDMLEILYRIIEGPDVRELEKNKWNERKYEMKASKKDRRKHVKDNQERGRMEKLEKTVGKAKKAIDKYSRDENYRFLHDSISDLFSELLKKDLENLKDGNLSKISLASKWCPSLDSSYDRSTLMCESVARKMFPKDVFMEYGDMEDRHYAYRVRDRLRKEVLVPLHKALELPEVYMCANKWDELPYNRVPSVAMKNYMRLFFKHDEERLKEYLDDVKSGKTTIAAGALLPHEIIAQMNNPEAVEEVAELQWKRMVDDLAKKGSLSNCMAICDVSGSMSGTPMEVCVALGLLISELSEVSWKNKLITFSANPQFHVIEGDSLKKKANSIERMDWGGNTDFQRAFDRILEVAVMGKLREDQMIKRLFVFSDMEFDEASSSRKWETDYQVIQRKFHEKGYQNVPEIVFWNLRNSRATPVPSNQPGVALVSGFSKNLVTIFLEEGGIMSPEAVMVQAISGDEYQKLVVYD